MPSVAVISCQGCQATSEHQIAGGPIPVISPCPCGGQRQVSQILFRPRDLSAATGHHAGHTPAPTQAR